MPGGRPARFRYNSIHIVDGDIIHRQQQVIVSGAEIVNEVHRFFLRAELVYPLGMKIRCIGIGRDDKDLQ